MSWKRSEGNGHPAVKIDVVTRSPGHVIICPQSLESLPDNLPLFLSRALEDWLGANPTFRVRSSVSIVADSQTVALHVWFDDLSGHESS